MNPPRTHHLAAAASAVACAALAASTTLARPSGLLLVTNKGDHTLSLVDVAAGHQLATIDEAGVTGHEVTTSPDGRLAFVPIYGSTGVGQAGTDGSLLRVIDLQKRAIVGTVDFRHGVRPHCPRINPRNGLLYVTTELDNAVTVIDPKTLSIVGSIPTGRPQSHMLAITRDGRRGYTANVSTGTVSVLDLEARTLVTVIPAAPRTQRIALSADDREAFTADQAALRLVVIDTETNTVSGSIPLPGLGFGATPAPDGRWLLVTLPALNEVGFIDLKSRRVVQTVSVPKAPQEILVAADGSEAYVSCDASRQIAVIDLASRQVSRLIDVGAMDDGLAWAAR